MGANQNYSSNVRKQVAMSLIMDIYMTSVMDTFLDKDDDMMLRRYVKALHLAIDTKIALISIPYSLFQNSYS